MPSTFSGEPRDFYLGVVHAESNRAYQNYFYKMQVGARHKIYQDLLPNCCNQLMHVLTVQQHAQAFGVLVFDTMF